MFKHTVEYVDFNGNPRKEELYFHLSLPEVTRLQAEVGVPMEQHVETLRDSQNLNELIKFLEKMILSSYGQKTLDGRSFIKNDKIRAEFEHSQAYAEIFEQLLTNADLGRKFGENVADNGKARKNAVAPTVVDNPPQQG